MGTQVGKSQDDETATIVKCIFEGDVQYGLGKKEFAF